MIWFKRLWIKDEWIKIVIIINKGFVGRKHNYRVQEKPIIRVKIFIWSRIIKQLYLCTWNDLEPKHFIKNIEDVLKIF